ncbi:hypothetical protein BREVNS_1306 [Brevinematales bacterium NS]|nr:hypothetical protein BREVNS_1306 [Brevinematales bacterium NS]
MWIENHKEFYDIILSKYHYLFDSYGFRIVFDEVFYDGIVREVHLKNEICEIHFEYERGGYGIDFVKENKRYDSTLLMFFFEEIKGVPIGADLLKRKEGRDEIGVRELFLIEAVLLQHSIDIILEHFKDENYEEFKRRYEEWRKSLR